MFVLLLLTLCDDVVLQIVYSRQGSRLSCSSRDSGHFGVAGSPSVSPPYNGATLTMPLIPRVSHVGESTNSPLTSSRLSEPSVGVVRNGPLPPARNCAGVDAVADKQTRDATYVNNDVGAEYSSRLGHCDYDRLLTQQRPRATGDQRATADNDSPRTATECDVSVTVALAAGADINRDSGYVQHDEWLSKVLGIAPELHGSSS